MVAPVEAAVDGPVLRDLKGVDDMGEAAVPIVLGVVPEFFKELALVYVPAAVEPGLPQLRRELFQGTQIFRLAFHQGLVVRAQGLDEGIVLRVLLFRKIPVDEQPLEVAVGRSAGVQGVVGPFGKGVDAPDAGVDLHQPLLLELPCLIGKPNVVFRTLVLPQVPIRCAVAEGNGASVGKMDELVRAFVLGHPCEQLLQGSDMVVEQLLIGLSGDEYLDAWVVQAQQDRFPADEPAFAAAPGSAVAHVAVLFRQGQALLLIGPGHDENAIRHSTRSLLPEPP